jgi:hypothetical protein
MMERVKAERLKLMDKALEIVEKAGKPVSIYYVEYHLNVSRHTARALLLELAASGRHCCWDILDRRGFEPRTSRVQGGRSSRLIYRPLKLISRVCFMF